MAVPALALFSSVAAAYAYSESSVFAALLCSLAAVPLFYGRGARGSRFAAFVAQTVLLFGAVLRLAALGASVSAKQGDAAAAAVLAACAAISFRLAVSDKSAFYAPAPVMFFCFAALLVHAFLTHGGQSTYIAPCLPDALSAPAVLVCPLSASLAAGRPERDPAGLVKGCALGTAAACALILLPAGGRTFPFLFVPLCAAQTALELRAVIFPPRGDNICSPRGIEYSG